MAIKWLDAEQVNQLLVTVEKRKGLIGQRDTCIVRLLWETGMRIDECLSLTTADVNLDRKEIKIRRAKRNKSRTVAWRNDRTTELLREWLAVRPESDYVFPIVRGPGRGGEASKGNKIPTNSWRGEMKRYVELAGLPSWVSSHNLRHSFSMYMLDRGMLLPELQVLLGHSDMSTTGKYVESHNKQALSRAKSITDSF